MRAKRVDKSMVPKYTAILSSMVSGLKGHDRIGADPLMMINKFIGLETRQSIFCFLTVAMFEQGLFG